MNRKNKIGMYDVFSDLSDRSVEIGRMRDMLYLFGEQLDSEVETLHKEGQMARFCFMNRYRLLRSLLDAIEIQFADTVASMAETVHDMKCIMEELRVIPRESENI